MKGAVISVAKAKRILSAAMAPVLAMGLMPAVAFAADDADGEAQATLQAATIEALGTAAQDDGMAAQAANSNTFSFTDSGVTAGDAGGSGFSIDGTALVINKPGTYTITGSCAEGSITVDKKTTGVTLVLRDLTLSSSATAPLVVKKNNGDTSLVIEGTVTLVDKEDPANDDSADEALADAFEGAAVKVKSGSNLTISGTGTLNADGSACKNGIKGAEAVAITIEGGVTVNATAANTGIASDGSLAIEGGVITVQAGNDGIKVSPDSDDTTSAGVLVISGGTVNVTAADDGIKADPDAGSAATETGGTTTITGGTITVSAGDDGIKAYNDLNIGTKGAATGPTVNVTESYEGLEAATVNLYSGTGSITASDDGINAANKDILNGESADLFNLNIYGGTWTVNAVGDGLDSNGNLTVSGGKTVVYGPTTGGNGVFDFLERGGAFTVSGGSLLGLSWGEMEVVPTSGTYVVFGSTGSGSGMPGGMGGGPGGGAGGFRPMSAQSEADAGASDAAEMSAQAWGGPTQGSGGASYSISAGQSVVVKDSSGTEVASTTAAKNARWVLYAGEGLQSGSTYTLSAAGSQIASATAAGGTASGSTGGVGGTGGASGGNGGSSSGNASEGGSTGAGASSGGTGGSGQGSSSQASGSQMFRLYNPNSGEHFYTANSAERDNLVKVGWNYEGIGWTAPSSGVEVYRLYNPNAGDHHYTTSASERDYLVSVGWKYEGVGWRSAGEAGTALYRLYNPNAVSGTHHYTTSTAERDWLASLGWQTEGIGWYGVK